MADAAKSSAAPQPEAATTAKTAKHRSPNYPVIGLRKAVERTVKLYDTYKKGWIPVPVMHQNMGYKPMSGAGKQVTAALKAYGLLDTQGEGEKAEARISERAYRIVMAAPDREGLLRAAALGPGLHAELWKKYGDHGLPPDDAMKHYLLFERSFNPDSVDGFIAQFKDTIAFSKLDEAGKVGAPPPKDLDALGGDGDDEQGETMGDETNPDPSTASKPPAKVAAPRKGDDGAEWAGPKMVLDLPRGNRIEIRLRSKVTAEEFKKIQKIYDLSELSFVDEDEEKPAE